MKTQARKPPTDVATTPSRMPTHASLLQRKCSCGGRADHDDGECEECRRKSLLQRRSAGPGSDRSPPVVREVLTSPGRHLDAGVRRSLEPRFGHDFSRVRIHTDGRAAESAKAVGALAYTVGEHVVFGSGQYAPTELEGRRLLAHELTHVVQQRRGGARLQPHAVSPPLIGMPGDALEREAESVAEAIEEEEEDTAPWPIRGAGVGIQRAMDPLGTPPLGPRGREPFEGIPESARRGGPLPYREATELSRCLEIMGEENAAYCRQEVLGQAPPPPAPPPACVPSRDLAWADFTASPPASSPFGAKTSFRFDRETHLGAVLIRAFFTPATSWVKPKFENPTDRAVNGCAGPVGDCEQHFDDAAQQGLVDVTYSLGPTTGCAAAVQPDTSLEATDRDECDSILGAECDRVAQLESQRLLRHERYHFKLACEMAKKGTRAMATLPSGSANHVLAAVRQKANQQTTAYDDQTRHGCDPGAQATWETDIDGGLPSVTIP